jgi:hypothetical protein
MALFATIERDSPEPVKLTTLAHLASDFKDKRSSRPDRQLSIILYGYLTTVAASDLVKEEIERDLMNRSMSAISKTLVRLGVPIDKLYIGEYVFSGPKARKIDIFLQQQGEAAPNLPGNPPVAGRTGAPNFPKPVRDAELSINNKREIVLEVTAFKIASGRRTLVPEISFRSSTGISPVEISKGFSSQLVLWKPKLEGLLRRIGQEGIAEKIEFAVKIIGGGGLTKEFARQISVEVAASLQAALTFNITIPGTKRELPIELSYSFGAAYRSGFSDPTGGSIGSEGQGMIKVTLFKFK